MSGVVVERAGLVEFVHRVHVAVVDSEGRLTASVGDAERVVFHRSAAKPFQAVSLADDQVAERFGLTPEELALCCFSHNGEPEHESLAQSILSKADLDESDLECGPHLPLDKTTAQALLRTGGSS
jgi:L-asparaginase II